jgi:hypothetical protein
MKCAGFTDDLPAPRQPTSRTGESKKRRAGFDPGECCVRVGLPNFPAAQDGLLRVTRRLLVSITISLIVLKGHEFIRADKPAE